MSLWVLLTDYELYGAHDFVQRKTFCQQGSRSVVIGWWIGFDSRYHFTCVLVDVSGNFDCLFIIQEDTVAFIFQYIWPQLLLTSRAANNGVAYQREKWHIIGSQREAKLTDLGTLSWVENQSNGSSAIMRFITMILLHMLWACKKHRAGAAVHLFTTIDTFTRLGHLLHFSFGNTSCFGAILCIPNNSRENQKRREHCIARERNGRPFAKCEWYHNTLLHVCRLLFKPDVGISVQLIAFDDFWERSIHRDRTKIAHGNMHRRAVLTTEWWRRATKKNLY